MADGAHDHAALTAHLEALDTIVGNLRDRIVVLENPDTDPVPPDPIPTGVAPFRFAISFVQNTKDVSFAAIAGTGLEAGIHGVGFGGNSEGTDLAARLAKIPASVPVIVHGAFAPQSMSTNTGKAPWLQPYARVRPDQAYNMGLRFGQQCKAFTNVEGVSYSNEHKGYGSGDKAQFVKDYIVFMDGFEHGIGRVVRMYGPYANGGDGIIERQAWHQAFIDGVIKPHPELAMGFCFDCSDGIPEALDDLTPYVRAGLTIPGYDFEHYPGGVNQAPASMTEFVDDCLFLALQNQLVYSSTWGVGALAGSDGAMAAPLLEADGKTWTAYGKAYIALNAFTAFRPIVKVSAGKYTNAKGQTATVSGTGLVLS